MVTCIVVDYAYATFVLHAFMEDEQDAKWLKVAESTRKTRKFLLRRVLSKIHAVVKASRLEGMLIDTHYRRFTSCEELIAATARAGF